MANIFESTYTKVQELKTQIEQTEEGSVAREAIMAEYDNLMKGIEALGAHGMRIWREYENALDNGNERLDINDVVHNRDAEGLVECMRTNGITEFTFSSGWSSSVDIAWLFIQNGYKLAGMVKVNGRKNFLENKHDEMHGYLFEAA